MAMTAQGMADKIKAARAAMTQQTTDAAEARAIIDQQLLALCQGIIAEIVQNSELVPITTDRTSTVYPYGEGIITGKVK